MIAVVLAAIAPNFLLILAGWAMHARAVLAPSFWPQAERLTYYLLLPALLVTNLAEARLDGLPVAGVLATQAVAITTMAVVCAGALRRVWPALRADGPAFTSLFQGAMRPNTYIGFAAAAGLWGGPGITVSALCAAVAVPLVNVLCVSALMRWGAGRGGGRGPAATVMALARNPLILACLAGIALNLTGIGLPPVVGPLLKILAQASLALGLLCVGAGLDFAALAGAGTLTAATLGLKLAVLPALAAATGLGLGLTGDVLAGVVIYAALPVATNAFILARLLGGDARLAAAIITASTLASAATLPAWGLAIAHLP